MHTRPQEDKELILSSLEETYYIENFVTQDDIKELCEIYDKSDKTEKQTGPITSSIKDFKVPVMRKITDKINNLYTDCEIYYGMYFYVERPHIIHNDDNREKWPKIYKAFNIPLRFEGEQTPHLCFFDQIYLDGPSKFFKGETDIQTHYNTCVYDYKDVLGKTDEEFDPNMKEKYLTHLKDEWLEGLSFNSAHEWTPGNAIVFDCCRLHCASDFTKIGVKNKLGISIFTKHRG